MQIQIIKENKGYFAQIVGELGIHAVADTPEKAVEILIDLYQEVMDIRKIRIQKSIFDFSKPLISMPFKSLMVNI